MNVVLKEPHPIVILAVPLDEKGRLFCLCPSRIFPLDEIGLLKVTGVNLEKAFVA